MHIRIITYNIHKGIGGLDRRYRPQRIVEVLQRYEADIVLLQEVDDQVPRSSCDCQVELFADALNFKHYAFQRNVRLTRGHYGNAILSRFPLADVQHVNLTIPLKKRRRALLAHCHIRHEGHQRSMLITNLHLGLSGLERRIQLRRVLDSDMVRNTHHQTPMIIGGDYNDVWSSMGRIMQPEGFASAGGQIMTYPAALPARALDRVYYRGDLKAYHAFASRLKVARHASDHLPLVTDFELLVDPQQAS